MELYTDVVFSGVEVMGMYSPLKFSHTKHHETHSAQGHGHAGLCLGFLIPVKGNHDTTAYKIW